MLKKLLSKDNFWNLMFWVMNVAAFAVLQYIIEAVDLGYVACIMILATPFFVGYFIKRKQNITINSKNVFINSKGEKLDKRYPKHLIWVLLIAAPLSIALLFKTKNIPLLNDSLAAYAGIILLVPTLYFILINCPISILLNSKGWSRKVTGLKKTNASYNLFDNMITDPAYSSNAGNINHMSYKRRMGID